MPSITTPSQIKSVRDNQLLTVYGDEQLVLCGECSICPCDRFDFFREDNARCFCGHHVACSVCKWRMDTPRYHGYRHSALLRALSTCSICGKDVCSECGLIENDQIKCKLCLLEHERQLLRDGLLRSLFGSDEFVMDTIIECALQISLEWTDKECDAEMSVDNIFELRKQIDCTANHMYAFDVEHNNDDIHSFNDEYKPCLEEDASSYSKSKRMKKEKAFMRDKRKRERKKMKEHRSVHNDKRRAKTSKIKLRSLTSCLNTFL